MDTSEKTMHFVAAADENYLPHACTVFRSAYETNKHHPLFFHLMTTDAQIPPHPKLQEFFREIRSETCHAEVILVEKDDPFLSAQPQGGVTPYQAAYLRFLASDRIPAADRILYLDCDTLVLEDLEELFTMPLGEKTLAVVAELFAGAFIFALGFGLRYFNSGVMLINARKWREEHLTVKAAKFIQEKFSKLSHGKKHYGDQDILNMLFSGQVVYLHPRYNLVNPVLLRRCFFRGKLFDDAAAEPAIVHFAGSAKPWNRWDYHPLTEKYLFYRRQTPWPEIPQQKGTLARVLKYWGRRLKYHCPWLIYPAADLLRRLLGYPSRVVHAELIEHLMEETR
ncbi:MAG: glycosyltransferase family 8 protein [Planctomycetaceae bacterium]|jgi:lipopolysaccharide biosynthesis glycosyltransferase|nr:glycosyltransferase family 8 protein [Planctomycetaceae bacterium]